MSSLQRRWLLPVAAVVALVAGLALPRSAAADEGWTIPRFHSDIAIQRDGSLLVTETIDASFSVPKHGIFRDIPVRYGYDAHHDRVYDLNVRSVTDASGVAIPYQRSKNGYNVELKIGDAARTIIGPQTYVIAYELKGALNAFPDHDELYWNVNGADWGVSTGEVSATVRLDGGGLERAQCYEGVTGSQEACNFLTADDRMGFVTKQPLAPGEQLTIVAGIRKGAVAEPTVRLVDSDPGFVDTYFTVTPWTVGTTLAVLLAGIGLLLLSWWRSGRDRVYTSIYYLTNNAKERTRPLFHRDDVVVEYTPPEGLRPAQMGLLLDERVDQKDLTATIVDLAVRGYLKITELEKTWALGRPDWQLTKLKKPKDLKPYEVTLFNGLMGDRDEVLLSDLHTDYAFALMRAQTQLYDEAVQHHWFTNDPAARRNRWQLYALAALFVGVLMTWGLSVYWGDGLVGLPVLFLGAVMIPFSTMMPKRTARGSELLRRVLGFRLYIDTAEKERQKFNEQQNIFAEYLPYAIVFGCVDKWAGVFSNAQTAALMSGWYEPHGAYPVMTFSSHLEGFSHSVAHCANAAPMVIAQGGGGGRGGFWGGGFGSGFSGGGFGGGGFAGGGGGGGGGGSW